MSIISIRQQLIEFLPICGQYALSYSLENLSMMSVNPTIMVSTLDGFRLTRMIGFHDQNPITVAAMNITNDMISPTKTPNPRALLPLICSAML